MSKQSENSRKREESKEKFSEENDVCEARNAIAMELMRLKREEGKSISMLAKEAGVSPQTLYSIIGGKAVSFKTASKIADALMINLKKFTIKDARTVDVFECLRMRREELKYEYF